MDANRGTNKMEADRVLRRWADGLRKVMDKVHDGKS